MFMTISSTTNSTCIKFPVGELSQFLERELSPKRYRHCLRVAETARELCVRHGLDESAGHFAGLGHDLAREWPADRLFRTAAADRSPISRMETENPLLLHGRAAAVIIERDFGVAEVEILEAIRNHTLGRAGLGPLGRLLYLADYVEPKRRYLKRGFRETVMGMDLDRAILAVVKDANARWKNLAEATQAMYDEIRSELAE